MRPAGGATRKADAVVQGDRIRFLDQGEGDPVLLVHGAYGRGDVFARSPFGLALSSGRRIIAPDALGHGDSDAPADPGAYGPDRRADHLAAALDAAGVERAHVVGYSMGGWAASALATRHPDRIASLAIGGWDVVDGMYTPAKAWGFAEITYDVLTALVRQGRPELLEDVTPEREPGLAMAINAMNTLAGLAEGVAACPAPTALWIGRDDLYHDAGRRFAEATGCRFISLPGDHETVIHTHGAAAAARVSHFIETSGEQA